MVLRSELAVCALAVAFSVTAVWGCASRSALVLPGVAVPSAPMNAEEALIADALTRVLVDDQDFPDYAALRTADTLIVMSDYRSGQAMHRFGPGALPHLSLYQFVLLTSNEVRRVSEGRPLKYLSVEIPDITAEPTKIEVQLANCYSRNSLVQRSNTVVTYEPVDNIIIQRRPDIAHRAWFASDSYILSYSRVDHSWQFVRVIGQINRN